MCGLRICQSKLTKASDFRLNYVGKLKIEYMYLFGVWNQIFAILFKIQMIFAFSALSIQHA